MSTLKATTATANAVAQKLAGKVGNEAAFDPSTILVIIQIIQQVMAALKDCKKPASAVAKTAESPGPFQRFKLRRIVREQLDDDGFYRSHGEDIAEAVLHAGVTLTESEAKHLMAEAGGG